LKLNSTHISVPHIKQLNTLK